VSRTCRHAYAGDWLNAAAAAAWLAGADRWCTYLGYFTSLLMYGFDVFGSGFSN